MDRYFLYCLRQARAILLAQLAGNHAMTVDTPLTTVTPARCRECGLELTATFTGRTRGAFTIARHGFFSCIKERRQNGSEPVSRIKEALVCGVANSVACRMSALMYWASCSASLCIRLRATPSKVRSISPGRPRSQSSTAISEKSRAILS